MPQPNKIPLAFAASGDKNTIPESTETTGLASWREGFPKITSAPFSEGGIAPKRADFNGIFNALSQSVIWLQQGGVYAYDSNTDYEPGTSFSTLAGCMLPMPQTAPRPQLYSRLRTRLARRGSSFGLTLLHRLRLVI